MSTTVILNGAIDKQLDELLLRLRYAGVTITRKEAAFSLIHNGLRELDSMEKQGINSTEIFLKKFVNFRGKQGRPAGNSRHVIRVEDGEEFNSCLSAAFAMGVTELSIRRAVTGKQNTCMGYHWQYLEKTVHGSITENFLEE